MRFKFVVLSAVIALALPLTACADGLFRGCNSCDGRIGLFHHAPPPPPQGHGGFGFFQPPFQAAPWYLYWPYDQHFQMPAPIGAPYFAPQAYANPMQNNYFPPAAAAPIPAVR